MKMTFEEWWQEKINSPGFERAIFEFGSSYVKILTENAWIMGNNEGRKAKEHLTQHTPDLKPPPAKSNS